jgi:HlyD family secretion protein
MTMLIADANSGVAAPRAPHTRTRWILAGATLVILAATGIFLWVQSSAKPAYITARIVRGDIDSTVTTTGNLNAVITVQVGSQVSGNILALYADFNTKVKKGQLVGEIDPAPFKAAVDQAGASLNAAQSAVLTASAALAQARANLVSAQANVASQRANVVKAQSAVNFANVVNDRRKVMVQNGSTAQEDADTTQAAYDQALASMDAVRQAVTAAEAAEAVAREGIDVAQHQLDQAKAVVEQQAAIVSQAQLNLSHTRILAPVDGTVESRNMDVGQTVAASFAAPTIFLIAQDLTKMQVDTNVDESDVSRIHLDQPATFTVDAWPGQTFRGRVVQIRQAPINVQNVITYDVVVQVSNDDLKLFPGMTANVTISVGHASKVLKLPKAALRFHPKPVSGAPAKPAPQTQIVSVPDAGGKLQQLPVKTGLSDANFVEIVSGNLQEGQLVVTGTAALSGTTASRPATGGAGPGRGL